MESSLGGGTGGIAVSFGGAGPLFGTSCGVGGGAGFPTVGGNGIVICFLLLSVAIGGSGGCGLPVTVAALGGADVGAGLEVFCVLVVTTTPSLMFTLGGGGGGDGLLVDNFFSVIWNFSLLSSSLSLRRRCG